MTVALIHDAFHREAGVRHEAPRPACDWRCPIRTTRGFRRPATWSPWDRIASIRTSEVRTGSRKA